MLFLGRCLKYLVQIIILKLIHLGMFSKHPFMRFFAIGLLYNQQLLFLILLDIDRFLLLIKLLLKFQKVHHMQHLRRGGGSRILRKLLFHMHPSHLHLPSLMLSISFMNLRKSNLVRSRLKLMFSFLLFYFEYVYKKFFACFLILLLCFFYI